MKNTDYTFHVKAIRANTKLYFIIFSFSFYNLQICILLFFIFHFEIFYLPYHYTHLRT